MSDENIIQNVKSDDLILKAFLNSQNFFTSAKTDIKISKIAHSKGLYPISLYHLLLSIEKLTKSILFFVGYITRGKEIGHELKDASKLSVKKLKDESNNNPEFEELITSIITNFEEYSKTRTFAVNNENTVSRIHYIKSQILKKLPKNIKNKIFANFNKTGNLTKNMMCQYEFVVNGPHFINSQYIVWELAYFFENNDSYRYPDENNPQITLENKYNAEHPLIKNYLELYKLQNKALKEFDKIFNIFEK